MTVEPDRIVHRFADGFENVFDFAWADGDAEFQRVARWAGYHDHRLYAIEHDATHHGLANHLRWTWSRALHNPQTDYVPGGPMPRLIAWEEHCVTRLQRLARTGEPDEFGVLPKLFPNLPASVDALRHFWANPNERTE